MNKTVKSVLFGGGIVLIIGLTVMSGYLGLHGKTVKDRSRLTYTDKIEMKDGKLDSTRSSVEFYNEAGTSYNVTLKWGNSSEKYSFLTMTKIVAPSGKAEAWTSGDYGECEMNFELSETGTYTIYSEYYCTEEEFEEACRSLDPNFTIEGSPFVFTGEDGSWEQNIDVKMVASE